jgi:lysophospholipase L1-like esterase
LGFRGDSIRKEGFRVMSLGCSNTEGVGVNNDQTWPAQFTNLIPNGVNFNFGTGGRSNDFIVRCLLTYYDIIKPDLILIMYTSPFRREIYTKDGGIEPFMPTTSWGYLKETDEGIKTQENLTYLQNSNEDFINWYKNHLLIKHFLESKKCNWIWNGREITSFDYSEFNRFDGDYSKYLDFGTDGTHPGPKHNETYAHKLHDFITKKFPSYINYLPKNRQNLI